MNLKKLIKKSLLFVSLATFTLSVSLNAGAIKPTPDQLKSFYSPFNDAYTTSLTSRYFNIRYLAGLDTLEKKIGEEFSEIVKKLRSPNDFETFEEYEAHLTHYRINAGKLLELDRKITLLCNVALKETHGITAQGTDFFLEFYEELPSLLSIEDCNEFVVKAQQFTEKLGGYIMSSSVSADGSPIDAYTEKFSNARREAQVNFELFLKQE